MWLDKVEHLEWPEAIVVTAHEFEISYDTAEWFLEKLVEAVG